MKGLPEFVDYDAAVEQAREDADAAFEAGRWDRESDWTPAHKLPREEQEWFSTE